MPGTHHDATQAERITALEVRVEELIDGQKTMNGKIDDLLSLKHKGAGAFWLASILVGTSIAGFVTQIVSWFKG
jgi:hypothetical protein